MIGTDAYLAPEQADPGRLGVPGPASDVWGLGATLFHAIAGERPFAEGDPPRRDVALERHPQVVADAAASCPAASPDEVAKVVDACPRAAPGGPARCRTRSPTRSSRCWSASRARRLTGFKVRR